MWAIIFVIIRDGFGPVLLYPRLYQSFYTLVIQYSSTYISENVFLLFVRKIHEVTPQGVVTLLVPVEPFATGIKIFDWRNFTLIA